jgi:hypothetical protein
MFKLLAGGNAVKGHGLNSIPVRFALLTVGLSTLCVSAQAVLWQEAAS